VVGEEEAFIGGGEGEEEEEDRNLGETASVRATCPLPTWLKEDFEWKVGESKIRGKDGLPPLYRDLGTFWFPRKSKFFVFRRSSTPTPSALYNYDMFLWDPESLLSDGLPCPNCKTRLYRHGHVKKPRRCVNLSRTIWIIGY
jgi:hypothetical protein